MFQLPSKDTTNHITLWYQNHLNNSKSYCNSVVGSELHWKCTSQGLNFSNICVSEMFSYYLFLKHIFLMWLAYKGHI